MAEPFKIVIHATTDIHEPVTLEVEDLDMNHSYGPHVVTALTDALCRVTGALSAHFQKTGSQHEQMCEKVVESIRNNSKAYFEEFQRHPEKGWLH
jgi:hypothetical protein